MINGYSHDESEDVKRQFSRLDISAARRHDAIRPPPAVAAIAEPDDAETRVQQLPALQPETSLPVAYDPDPDDAETCVQALPAGLPPTRSRPPTIAPPAEDTRDTVVSPQPSRLFSLLRRVPAILLFPFRALKRAFGQLVDALLIPRVSHRLPPVPVTDARKTLTSTGEHSPVARGERVFADLWRIPPAYLYAVILIAQFIRRTAPQDLLPKRVHFTIARMIAANQVIPIARIREALHEVATESLNEALRTLEQWGDIALLPPNSHDVRAAAGAISDEIRGCLANVQLRKDP